MLQQLTGSSEQTLSALQGHIETMPTLTRLGVIGLGNIGLQHIRHINEAVNGCQLTAVCSRQSVSAEKFPGAQHFSDYKKLVDSGLVDAVIIATPTMAHLQQGQYALSKGLHVLMEKPLSLSSLQGQQLLDCAGEDQVFALMLNQRTDPLFRSMKNCVDSGQLGSIVRSHWTMTNWFRPEVYFMASDWRATWKGEGGGLLVNQCIHNLDIMQWICGMPTSLRGHCSFGKYHNIEVEDEASAFLHYENGATGFFTASTGEAPGINRFDIVGDLATLSFDGERLTLLENSESSSAFSKNTADMFAMPEFTSTDLTPDRRMNQHAAIIQNFIDAIDGSETLIAPAKVGLDSLALANAILLSAWTTADVQFPLDQQYYQRELDARISISSLRDNTGIAVNIDMDKSFR